MMKSNHNLRKHSLKNKMRLRLNSILKSFSQLMKMEMQILFH